MPFTSDSDKWNLGHLIYQFLLGGYFLNFIFIYQKLLFMNPFWIVKSIFHQSYLIKKEKGNWSLIWLHFIIMFAFDPPKNVTVFEINFTAKYSYQNISSFLFSLLIFSWRLSWKVLLFSCHISSFCCHWQSYLLVIVG